MDKSNQSEIHERKCEDCGLQGTYIACDDEVTVRRMWNPERTERITVCYDCWFSRAGLEGFGDA